MSFTSSRLFSQRVTNPFLLSYLKRTTSLLSTTPTSVSPFAAKHIRFISMSRESSSSNDKTKPNTLFLNTSRLDYDEGNKLDFSHLSEITNFIRNDVDHVVDDNNGSEILKLIEEANAEIVITKEMEISASTVSFCSTFFTHETYF